jgi:transposase InsO family protein
MLLNSRVHSNTLPAQSYAPYGLTPQGSEYDAQDYTDTAESLGIKISMSKKQSPWENSYQESFYSNFKVDLADPNRFELLGELIEAIHQTIRYYNAKRIHTALKMSPEQYRLAYSKSTRLCTTLSR